MIENNILGVILAGGRSSRFGSNKAEARLEDKTLLEHTIAKVEKNFLEVLIVSNEESININKNTLSKSNAPQSDFMTIDKNLSFNQLSNAKLNYQVNFCEMLWQIAH